LLLLLHHNFKMWKNANILHVADSTSRTMRK